MPVVPIVASRAWCRSASRCPARRCPTTDFPAAVRATLQGPPACCTTRWLCLAPRGRAMPGHAMPGRLDGHIVEAAARHADTPARARGCAGRGEPGGRRACARHATRDTRHARGVVTPSEDASSEGGRGACGAAAQSERLAGRPRRHSRARRDRLTRRRRGSRRTADAPRRWSATDGNGDARVEKITAAPCWSRRELPPRWTPADGGAVAV